MKIKETIIIDRSRDIVWVHIHDPSRMTKWNPRIREFKSNPSVLPGTGYEFTAVYEMLGKADHFNAEILEYHNPKHLLIGFAKVSEWLNSLSFNLSGESGTGTIKVSSLFSL